MASTLTPSVPLSLPLRGKARGKPGPGEVHLRHAEADWYVKFLANPQAVNPNSTMPAYAGIGETKLRALAEWMRDPDRETR